MRPIHSSSGDIHYIILRAIVQATESEERVKTALSLFHFDEEIESIRTEGHFGNPITILQTRIKGKKCSQFINLLRSELQENDLKKLKKEIDERTDEGCSLHIRLDKQAAYQGKVKLPETKDTIVAQIKIKAYPARRDNAVTIAENFF